MSYDLVGKQLGKYEIKAEIGRGGMGTVYLAYDPLLDRQVAIKVLAPHLVWEQGFVERFLREARSAARIKHPNIVTIYDVGQEGNWYYFVMEYVEGPTLAEAIRQRGPLPPAEALAILAPLAGALDSAHAQGLIHRDIKSGNVLLGPAGQVTLTDFGIARAVAETRLTTTGMLIGTPEYMSPEQVRGEQVDHRTDLYSLAIVAYEMLAGRTPFGGTTPHGVLYRQINDPPPSISHFRPGLSAAVESVLGRALAKDPANRFSTAGVFVEALASALADQPALTKPPARMSTAAEPPVSYQDQPAAAPWPARFPARTAPLASAEKPSAVPRPTPHSAAPRRDISRWAWVLGALAVLTAAGVLGLGLLALRDGGNGGEQGTILPATQLSAGRTAAPPTLTPPVVPAASELAGPVHGFECRDPLGCIDVLPGEPVQIGYLLLLSGPDAALGVDSRRGIEIAVADKAHVGDHPIELVGQDSGCSAEDGQVGAEKLAANPKLVAVVGPSCSSAARTAIPILCKVGVPLLGPSTTAPDLTDPDSAPCFLRIAHNDRVQGLMAARFAREVLGVARAATIHDDSRYSQALQQAFADAFTRLGGSITAQQQMKEDGADAGPALTQAAITKPQLLFYPLFVKAGAAVTRQAREMSVMQGVHLVGADGMFSPEFLRAAGQAAVGMFHTSPDLAAFGPRYEEFLIKYQEQYGQPPVSAYHAHAYDAAMLLLDTLDQVVARDEAGGLHIPRGRLIETLRATQGYQGLTGVLSCTPYGECADPKIAVYETIQPDPDTWYPGPGSENNPRRIWP